MILILPLVIAASLLIFYHIQSKHKQREMLIERGINPDGMSLVEYQKLSNLTNGILFIALALGLASAYLIRAVFDIEEFITVYLSALLFFGGIGFLANYFVYKSR